MSTVRSHRAGAVLPELLLAASSCVLALLGGCGQGGEGSPGGDPTGTVAAGSVMPTQLLQLMVDAPERLAFEATRRYEADWQVDGVGATLSYRERVVSDGAGGFAIDPLELLEPDMSSAERDLFLLLQKTREGFFFKHRDFGIRDLRLFLAGWRVTDRGQTSVLGRSCALLDVQRQRDPDRTYQLAVDDRNGLILRAEERDSRGRLLSLLEYESLNLSPAPEPEALHRSAVTESVVDSEAELRAALSFLPVQPRQIPSGYRLLGTAAVVDPIEGGEWARFTYGDGVEELFFLHGGRSPEPGAAGRPGATTAGRDQQTVSYLYVGPWTVLFGELDRGAFLAMGKVSREALQDLVESAFF